MRFPSTPSWSSIFLIPHTDAASLRQGLWAILDRMASVHGLELPPDTQLEIRFGDLLHALGGKNKVVILIDEYDKPIIEHLGNPDLAEGCRDVLRSFLDVIKGSDALIRFVFITGITRFSALFSEMNNLKDTSTDARYACLLGLSGDEIDHYLGDWVTDWAEATQESVDGLRQQMRRLDNGYRFTEAEQWVYNP